MDGFDFLVFPDGNTQYFTPRQIADIKYAIESGAGTFVTMGGGMATVTGYYGVRINTGLSDILPIVPNLKMRRDVTSGLSIKVVKDDPPVLSMFVPVEIEKVVGSFAFTVLYLREGATCWAKLISHGLPLPQDARVSGSSRGDRAPDSPGPL